MTQKQTSPQRGGKTDDPGKHAADSRKTTGRGKSAHDMDDADERPAEDMDDAATRGKGGNFANDPKRASDAGRKGGQASHSR